MIDAYKTWEEGEGEEGDAGGEQGHRGDHGSHPPSPLLEDKATLIDNSDVSKQADNEMEVVRQYTSMC